MATLWSKRNNNLNRAPRTVFTTSQLSPRQIANKAYTLGCKKLERDDKRSKQNYHVRERLLLFNTIAKAEEVLNSRTRRTNRRVMNAEDNEEDALKEISERIQTSRTQNDNRSPLRSSASEEDDEEEEAKREREREEEEEGKEGESILKSNSSLLPRDCRVTVNHQRREVINSPIASII
ncbi:hypothetical protein K501DRAFT_284263 [Backusella circina FSU 941]|nr:hypothetical protein K501DRAFT_284263 [Backusella circina FSU 941]